MEYKDKMRNPDGKLVSLEKALEEWKELTEFLEEIGCELKGFDPGISIYFENNSINLPVSFVRKLKQIIRKENNGSYKRYDTKYLSSIRFV